MKKLIACILAIVMMVPLAISGCGGEAAGPLPDFISIGTMPTGSMYYSVAVAAATVVENHTTMEAVPEPTAGAQAFLPLMKRGELEFGIANTMTLWAAYHGDMEFEELGQFPIRAIKMGNVLIGTIIVRPDSDIQSIPELKGRKVSLFPTAAPGTSIGTSAQLANWGLTPDDVIEVPCTSISEAADNFIEGKVEASLVALGTGLTEQIASTVGMRVLPLDPSPEGEARMKEVAPAMYITLVEPGPAAAGLEEPMYLQGMDACLICLDTLSDDVAYAVAEALWDGYDELVPIHPIMRQWSPERSVRPSITVPFHPGAIKFYEEKGVWTEDMQEIQDKLLAEY